jgi:hypothetical protein
MASGENTLLIGNKYSLELKGPALDTLHVVKTIRFVIDADDGTIIPEISVRPFV